MIIGRRFPAKPPDVKETAYYNNALTFMKILYLLLIFFCLCESQIISGDELDRNKMDGTARNVQTNEELAFKRKLQKMLKQKIDAALTGNTESDHNEKDGIQKYFDLKRDEDMGFHIAESHKQMLSLINHLKTLRDNLELDSNQIKGLVDMVYNFKGQLNANEIIKFPRETVGMNSNFNLSQEKDRIESEYEHDIENNLSKTFEKLNNLKLDDLKNIIAAQNDPKHIEDYKIYCIEFVIKSIENEKLTVEKTMDVVSKILKNWKDEKEIIASLIIHIENIMYSIQYLQKQIQGCMEELAKVELLIFVIGRADEDANLNRYKNFERAGDVAFDQFKQVYCDISEQILKFNKQGNVFEDFRYDLNDIPFIKRKDKKTGSDFSEFIVYLEIKIINNLTVNHKPGIFFYSDYEHRLRWTKHIEFGGHLVYAKVESLLYDLNRNLESKGMKERWRPVELEDLKMVKKNKDLLKALNIKIDINHCYWRKKINTMGNIVYRVYTFIDENDVTPELMKRVSSNRTPSEGAYCIFVKKMEEED